MLHAKLALKLLELTRHRSQLPLVQLTQEISSSVGLVEELEELQEAKLLSLGREKLELNSRQRVTIADRLIHAGSDPVKVSRQLDWKEFEDFAEGAFAENGFQVCRHFVFKTSLGRREIDILAWNDIFLFAVDCKHWLRHLSPSRMSEAANAQMERAMILAERPDLLTRLGIAHADRRSIVPMLLSLGWPRLTVTDGVPVVPISKLVSFLYGFSPMDDRFRRIRVKRSGTQLQIAYPRQNLDA